MKKLALAFVAVLSLVASSAFAGNFDGTYQFSSRDKAGTPDMQGWWGWMSIQDGTMTRVYHSPDGKQEKYYVGKITPEGEWQTVTFTQAYKPEYVGNKHKNKFILNGKTFTMKSDDGTFTEVWSKK